MKHYVNGELLDMTDEEVAELEATQAALQASMVPTTAQIKAEAARRLAETDWLVLRHRDQLDLGEETSLSSDQFTALLSRRRAIRDRSGEIEALESRPLDYTSDSHWPS